SRGSTAVAAVAATAITTLDGSSGLRRLTVKVPDEFAFGSVGVRVSNQMTGETTDARSLEIVTLPLLEPGTAAPGATDIQVRIGGSLNSQFVIGSTRVVFGAGITVRTTAVESPTSLVVTVDVAPNATVGSRDVVVISPAQRL